MLPEEVTSLQVAEHIMPFSYYYILDMYLQGPLGEWLKVATYPTLLKCKIGGFTLMITTLPMVE